jgi:hypothetical protein
MGVDDDMTDITSKDAIEAIVDKAPQELSVVGDVCIFSCFSSRARSLLVTADCFFVLRAQFTNLWALPR